MDARAILLNFNSDFDSIEQDDIIDPTSKAPFDHVLDTIRTAFTAIFADHYPASDDAGLAFFVSKLHLYWNRPMGHKRTHTSRLTSVKSFNVFWKYICAHEDFLIEFFASTPSHDTPLTFPKDVKDMPRRGSTPTLLAPSPTPPSKQAQAPTSHCQD